MELNFITPQEHIAVLEGERLILNGLGAIIQYNQTQDVQMKLSIHHNQVTQTQETANLKALNALELHLWSFSTHEINVT